MVMGRRPYGHDGPVLATDRYPIWGGGSRRTPQPLVEVMVVESTVDCLTAEPVAVSPPSMPDLSLEGPFDVHHVTLESGASPRVLDSLSGCQFR